MSERAFLTPEGEDALFDDPEVQDALRAALVEAFAWAIGDPRKDPELRKLLYETDKEDRGDTLAAAD